MSFDLNCTCIRFEWGSLTPRTLLPDFVAPSATPPAAPTSAAPPATSGSIAFAAPALPLLDEDLAFGDDPFDLADPPDLPAPDFGFAVFDFLACFDLACFDFDPLDFNPLDFDFELGLVLVWA